MEAARGCDRMDRYHVFSTTDMVNWTDYGEILNASQVPWIVGPFDNGSTFMWAPDAAYKNGKYYFYFPHPSKNTSPDSNDPGNWGNNWKVGVAVSDHPASGFEILDTPLALNTGFEYDPCVFVDDDGQAYIYYGGGAHPYVAKLKDNMTEVDGEPQVMEGLNNFHEGIWVHKYNGKYYLSYPDNGGGGANQGDQLKYAVSDSPMGPWESKDAYVYATGNGTIHGSIVEYKDQWYAFYHSDYVSNNGDQGRSVHVDELFYNEDGSIQVVQNWGEPFKENSLAETTNTSDIALTLQAEDFNEGGETYGFHALEAYPDGTTAGNVQRNNTNYRTVTGVSIESNGGGYAIGDIDSKEFLRYSINVPKAGLYDIDVYTASDGTDGRFHLTVNGVNKSGTVAVPDNNSWTTFQKQTIANIPLQAGDNLLMLYSEGFGFNLDRFEFRIAEPYSGTPYKTLNVPGRVEAEDFDNGGKNVAWYDNDDANMSNSNYRPGEGVDLEVENGNEDLVHFSWTNGGEWTKYTLNALEEGTYDITMRVSTGNGASGSLSLTFDDVYEYPSVEALTPDWNTYTTVTLKGVGLTAGKHVMQMTIGGNINVDWFDFVKVSDVITDVPQVNDGSSLTLYPNPTDGLVYLSRAADVTLYNMQGQRLFSVSGTEIDLSDYNEGVYVAIVTLENQTKQFKLIKK
jgi:hypothetical protein